MPDFDLFGVLIDPRKGMNGRPRHFPTKASRALVKRRAEHGYSQTAIAAELGITVPTLCRHYSHQLGSRSKLGGFYRRKGNGRQVD